MNIKIYKKRISSIDFNVHNSKVFNFLNLFLIKFLNTKTKIGLIINHIVNRNPQIIYTEDLTSSLKHHDYVNNVTTILASC